MICVFNSSKNKKKTNKQKKHKNKPKEQPFFLSYGSKPRKQSTHHHKHTRLKHSWSPKKTKRMTFHPLAKRKKGVKKGGRKKGEKKKKRKKERKKERWRWSSSCRLASSLRVDLGIAGVVQERGGPVHVLDVALANGVATIDGFGDARAADLGRAVVGVVLWRRGGEEKGRKEEGWADTTANSNPKKKKTPKQKKKKQKKNKKP